MLSKKEIGLKLNKRPANETEGLFLMRRFLYDCTLLLVIITLASAIPIMHYNQNVSITFYLMALVLTIITTITRGDLSTTFINRVELQRAYLGREKCCTVPSYFIILSILMMIYNLIMALIFLPPYNLTMLIGLSLYICDHEVARHGTISSTFKRKNDSIFIMLWMVWLLTINDYTVTCRIASLMVFLYNTGNDSNKTNHLVTTLIFATFVMLDYYNRHTLELQPLIAIPSLLTHLVLGRDSIRIASESLSTIDAEFHNTHAINCAVAYLNTTKTDLSKTAIDTHPMTTHIRCHINHATMDHLAPIIITSSMLCELWILLPVLIEG